MVLIAAFLDGIDGRVARLFKASSRFGAQIDSLADIVNFGVAPALVLYAYLLDSAGSPGWIAALLFVIACGLRLARFNVLDEDFEPAGLAGGIFRRRAGAGRRRGRAAADLSRLHRRRDRAGRSSMPACVFTVLVALLMISRLPVYSGKTIGKRISADRVVPLHPRPGASTCCCWRPTHGRRCRSRSSPIWLFLPLSARAYAQRAKLEALETAKRRAAAEFQAAASRPSVSIAMRRAEG